ncbi:heterodisulfide reductase subunit A [Candidatus Desantisbacteria bacterium CG2_30_40_21]|uniref:Heterodisulfide reductase subunit A n=1 Tax=Candidatus Desantisbacteria bacterium CG2_30_40_21 TaxID=1817895 RepID=A0A1J5DPZ8_9BACT|nr:MAG: heterodisulfide reductase subunit A [Candidatus Desantisbacteria bacterium CG2_30_40_21]
MDKKLGVYICSGCGIGDSLDIEKLTKIATKTYKVPVCQTHACLCSRDGVNIINKDCEAEGVNTIVIAACSLRANQGVFAFGNDRIVERVNLREHVIWSQPAKNEDTQMMAEDYLRMGIVKAQKAQLLDPYKPAEEISRIVMVVGGGITGITAALNAAKAGVEVVLVEKQDNLGGFSSKLHKHFPINPPYQDLQTPPHEAMIKEIKANSRIRVYTDAKIEKITGAPGLFVVSLKQKSEIVQFRVGAIVLAAGFVPYDATKLTHLGFGVSKNVITNVQMEELAKNGKILRPSDGKQAKNIAFIQCAGSRDKDHLPYCSSHCCMSSLKQALYIRQQDTNAAAYIFYKDMRTMGQHEDFYVRAQEDEGIFLTKGEVVSVQPVAGDKLIITVEDTLLGKSIQVEADMVVLATGMMPATGIKIEVEETITCNPEQCKPEDIAVPSDVIIPSDILNLEYRQGTEIPQLKYGFPDSHFICFPYETRRTGIYAAGCVRHPMDIGACIDDATGAALKAIQCIELTSQGKAVHPRVGDMSYPDFFMQRCTQCKRCTDECPFGAINEDEKFNPLPNPTRCRRCGTCMGACPERIISFKDYSIDIISSMMKAIEVPEEDEEKPRVLVFMCENDAVPALDMAGAKRLKLSPYIRVIPVRCLGSVHLVWITDALSKGIDGIILIGCKHGDDYQCHFVKGSELASIRLSKVKETLDRLRLESERVKMVELSINEYSLLPGIFSEFMETMEKVGPNPFKGF